MKSITAEEAAKATGGRLIRTCGHPAFTGVVHDSRECGPDDLFVCVKGENMDGHSFLPQVAGKGCRSALISDESVLTDDMDMNVILVDDTVRAMGDLARWYLDELDLIRIAVTGSVGKTSTRDMIYYVLNEKYRCGRNMKNYNNHIGLPLSIFQLDESYGAVVLEMGMSDFGEIEYLSGIVRPTIGVITNIGTAHMEHLGSRDGIFRAKMEITEHLAGREDGGLMVFASDEDYLNRQRTAGNYDRIFVGSDGRSDLIVTDIEDKGIDGIRFVIEHDQVRKEFSVPVPGRHNAVNAALAAAVGGHLGLSPEQIQRGLSRVELTGHRLRVVRGGDLTVIDDTYNASPASMKSALKVLEISPCEGKRTAILGEMYELGESEERLHYDVGVFSAGCRIDRLIGIGPLAEHIVRGAKAGPAETAWFETKEEFLRRRAEYIGRGDLILVKASRGMKMEEIVSALTEGQEKS